ncbi:hypothetical protein [Hanstruepera ponticola]|uniref:hypothetical protein n=1 Tax=Hanstruepera ponticola TaxID=2042995 RepID=UPI000CF03488|nr:hypothetical protein [Hanstruepera ponticola]
MVNYVLNPKFKVSKEHHSFIFTSHEHEYLLDVTDLASYDFMVKSIDRNVFFKDEVPKEFTEGFEALIQLHILEINSITK